MSHSFCAYIDESGDDGMKDFRQIGKDGGASHWLVISALVVRKSLELECVSWRNEILERVQTKRKHLHFVGLNHGQRVVATEILTSKPIRIVNIIVGKQFLDRNVFTQKNQLYSYATRYLLERVSWLCRDLRPRVPEGDGRAQITFSRRGGMSYGEFRSYLHRLQAAGSDETRIHWPVIDIDGVDAHDHSRSAALQLADIVASSFSSAIQPDRYGNCEGRYAANLRQTVYNRHGQYMNYGLKFIPASERCELDAKQKSLIELFQ